jgi:uncharacterized protein
VSWRINPFGSVSEVWGCTMPHPNEARLRDAMEAGLRGDMEPMRAISDSKMVWHVSGRGPLSGDLNGLDAVMAWGGQLFERSGGTWKEELLEVMANDDSAFMRTTYRATRGGRSIEDYSVNVFRIQNGKVVECWVYFGKPYDFDNFWS